MLDGTVVAPHERVFWADAQEQIAANIEARVPERRHPWRGEDARAVRRVSAQVRTCCAQHEALALPKTSDSIAPRRNGTRVNDGSVRSECDQALP